MPIGDNRPVYNNIEARRAHRAGASQGKLEADNAARLDTMIVPDEYGLYGGVICLAGFASTAMISGTFYALYLGRATGSTPFTTLSVVTTVAGTGAASGAAGFAMSAAGPLFANKTDITIMAVAPLDTTATAGRISCQPLVTPGIKFAPVSGDHIWAFCVTANATTQAATWGLTGEVTVGTIQVATGVSVASCIVGATIATTVRATPSITAFQSPQMFII